MVHERATLHALNRSRDMPLAHYLRLSDISYPLFSSIQSSLSLSLAPSLSISLFLRRQKSPSFSNACVHIQMSKTDRSISEDPKKKKRTGADKLSLDDTSEGFDSGLSARNKG